ncbi:hypothetical protein TWF281_007478 [Arthrobotrys megalospora]
MAASLWLIPPPGPLQTILQTLISTTLPVRIPGSITNPSSPPSPSHPPPKIQFKRLRYGTAFWTKITIEIHKSLSLKSLAVECRSKILPNYTKEEAEQWVEKYTTPAESGQEGFIPHLSLVYWGDEVEGTVRVGVGSDVNDAGVLMDDGEKDGVEEMGGWIGGKLVVVDTTKRVEEWKDSILAERTL